MMEVVQVNMDALRRGYRNAGVKDMLANAIGPATRHRTANCLERSNARLPAEHIGKHTRGHHKTRDILGHVVWLNNILRVFAARIPPSAKFDVHFGTGLLRP